MTAQTNDLAATAAVPECAADVGAATARPRRIFCPAIVAAIDAGHLRQDGNRLIEIEHEDACPGADAVSACICFAVVRVISANGVLTLDHSGQVIGRGQIQ